MKIFERVVLVLGFLTLGILVWKLNPAAVVHEIARVGWGFFLVLPFQIFDHAFNAAAWRLSFEPEQAKGLPFLKLLKGRIGGDGVNYLTPSGTIAGEFVRPGLLGPIRPPSCVNASVLIAKLSQSLAQALFILVGLVFVLVPLGLLSRANRALALGWGLLIAGVVCAAALFLARAPQPGKRWWQAEGRFSSMRRTVRAYFLSHPLRFALSIFFFFLGYLWGGAEVLLICHFLGLKLPLLSALAIEVLSNIVDSLMFMVPAKVGTQELGKTVIFYWMGFSPRRGLAFGLIRHLRELLWSGFGFLLYVLTKGPSPARPRELSELLQESS